jgi:hypothetical protein
LTSAFYNVAKDPAASDPKKHQAELGYTLFGPDEGMVDIDTELKRIVQSVEEEGATLATFWEVQQVVNLLRDAHVTAPSTNAGDLSQGYLAFIPDRSADGKIKARPFFSNDPVTKELKLKIHWVDEDGEKSESTVETINGARPYEFLRNVSNSPSISGLVYQSRGARLNELLMQLKTPAYSDANGNSAAILGVGINAHPSDVYPSEVQVKYEDGEEETYRSFLRLPNLSFDFLSLSEAVYISYNVNDTAIQESINQPGSVYLQDEKVADAIVNSSDRRARSLDVEVDAMSDTSFWDYQYPEPEDDPKPKVALKFMDEYAILKIEDFDLMPDVVMSVWQVLVAGAKEKGIKKLIVDLSNNGGGIAQGGMTLSQLMYPSVGKEVFSNDFTAVINEPMQIFRDELFPLYEILFEVFTNETLEEETMALFQNITDGFTDDAVRVVNSTIGSLPTFCECGDNPSIFCPRMKDTCEQVVGALQSQWASFVTNRTASQCMAVAKTMMSAVSLADRLNLLAYADCGNDSTCMGKLYACGNDITCIMDKLRSSEFVKGFKTVNQGGVLTNITNRMTFYSSSFYDAAQEIATQVEADFDEYIILSNGAGGSTTSIFASKVEQIWKNKDKSLVDTKLTTVSYGGLQGDDGDGDVTMAGFPATVEGINVAMQYVQFLLATILNKLFLDWLAEADAETFGEFDSALDKFIDSVAEAPYFSHTKPSFPVTQYYDSYMGPDALPLQYIKMPADEHIPLHYLDTEIQEYGDLEALYMQTAEFFSGSSVDPLAPTTPGVDSPTTASVDPSEKEADTSGAVAQSKSQPYLFGLWLCSVANVALYAIFLRV